MKLPALPWEKLAKLKKPHKLAIYFGTIVILAAAFFFLLYQPLGNDAVALQEDIDRLDNLIMQHRKTARELNDVRARLEDVKLEYAFISRLLPDTKEVPQLLKDISDNGARSGLNVTLFQPQLKDEIRDFYAEISFDMKVEGPYLNVASFFYRLGSLPRIVNIKDIQMGSPRVVENDMVLSTTCKGVTFRFLTPEEQAQIEEAKAAAAKVKKKPAKKGAKEEPI